MAHQADPLNTVLEAAKVWGDHHVEGAQHNYYGYQWALKQLHSNRTFGPVDQNRLPRLAAYLGSIVNTYGRDEVGLAASWMQAVRS